MSILKSILLLKNFIGNVCRTNFVDLAKTSNLLLPPSSISLIPSCGLKVKGIVRKRCADCYFVRREGRLYIMCKTFPRHKQVLMAKREKYTWILSHACQSKFRPY